MTTATEVTSFAPPLFDAKSYRKGLEKGANQIDVEDVKQWIRGTRHAMSEQPYALDVTEFSLIAQVVRYSEDSPSAYIEVDDRALWYRKSSQWTPIVYPPWAIEFNAACAAVTYIITTEERDYGQKVEIVTRYLNLHTALALLPPDD